MKPTLIAASILSADFANLEAEIKNIEKSGSDWIHVDVMDGVFVPNLTIGAPVIKSIRKVTGLTFDVHLMIIDPIRYISEFAEAGSDIITVHYEACKDNYRETIDEIKSHGIRAGLTIKPKTPVLDIEPYFDDIDKLLIMTVEPGFGGQSFMHECIEKIRESKKIIEERGLNVHIQVDGGITDATAKPVKDAGADVLVAGAYIFGSSDRAQAISLLRKA